MEKLLLILAAVIMYTLGENKKQIFKWIMGIPISLVAFAFYHNPIVFLAMPSYFVATDVFGYGDKNPWTKWLGETWAVILTGFMLGLASFPLIGYWSIMQAIIGAWAWYAIHVLDDAKKLQEPYISILRAIGATILI